MERVPERIGVAGDWHGNTEWATRAVRKISALLPADRPRVIVHLGDFGIWPGPDGQGYLPAHAALAAADAELWFVDGNHEDFTQLAGLRPGPDGREQVTERIWHLPRGHRWRWHGRDWLALGGAVSLDRAIGGGRRLVAAGGDHQAEAARSSRPDPPTSWSPTMPGRRRAHVPAAAVLVVCRDLRRSDAHRDLLQRVVLPVQPGWLMHGHLHLGYQRVDLGYGPVEVTGLDGRRRNGTRPSWNHPACAGCAGRAGRSGTPCAAWCPPRKGRRTRPLRPGRPAARPAPDRARGLRFPAPAGPARKGAVGGRRGQARPRSGRYAGAGAG